MQIFCGNLGAVLLMMLVSTTACSADTVDPRLVGTWQATMTTEQGIWTMMFTPAAEGTYRTVVRGPSVVPDHVGTFRAQNGQFRVKKSTGEVDQGTYQFDGPDTVTFKGSGPAIIWRRMAGSTGIVASTTPASPPASSASAPAPERAHPVPVDGQAEQLFQRAKGLFEAKRDREAVSVLRQAAERGHPMAEHRLGYLYQGGDAGLPKDERQAASWFAKAAAQGNRASPYALGSMYEEGEGGLPKDEVKAAQLYRQSAEQQFGQAEFSLGLAYEFGFGVPSDRRQATQWLDKAAEQGDGRAHWYSIGSSDRTRRSSKTKCNSANTSVRKSVRGLPVRDQRPGVWM
ncbi:MAG: tetratricopeptide repeat protein [Nitrospirota bacterium]